ncbi:uncharacterized protein F5891DRAFT_1189346 [Suillus fuscotomentosus]|uniref:JmjC domain-containing protein n=1 Tax=Suillus fuscotomentosus TaxID=1912939 RepID=A0AAD4E526_9AGAM|nr:uncharacterized protein F5891DRAFT_1189346 [Suillus fuscotomentosus]KAG1899874.1 hypothetical protein F5891DRAFT_1189346 [Suillus fuscotomentosus]
MPPRFRYPDLDGLLPEQKHIEQQKRWCARQMQDPEKAERIRARGRENKREQHLRTKLRQQSLEIGAPPPRFHRQMPSPASSDVSPSHSMDDRVTPTRYMLDTAVMADSISSPTNYKPTLKLDLASDILSIQVPLQSQTVTWSDGCRTVLPCVMVKGINVCEDNDIAVVHFLSLFPKSKFDSANVNHIERGNLTRGQVQDAVSEALCRNKPVVIRGFSSHDPPTLDTDYLETNFGISCRMRVIVHNVANRVNDFSRPHMEATIQQFINGINDPSKIQCISDMPLSQMGLPQEFQLLDHGLVYGWNQTTVDCPVCSGKVHPDNFTVKSWALLHQAGFITYPHHDADGAVTFVQVQTGIKFWIVFTTKEKLSRTALLKAQMLFADWQKHHREIESTWHGEVITLLPGDLVFQPAGQVHAVYTPVSSFTTGGNFYGYEYLHLTKISRCIDAHKAEFLTNQFHENALETFQRMTVALPRLP